MWAAVRHLTGRQQSVARVDGITAETLNQHYARVSSDLQYVAPNRKQSTDEDNVSVSGRFSELWIRCNTLLPG